MAGNELAMSDQAQEKRKAQWRQEAQLWSLASRGGLGTVSGDVVADGDSENSGRNVWKPGAGRPRPTEAVQAPSCATTSIKHGLCKQSAPPPLIPAPVLKRLTHSCNNPVSSVPMGQAGVFPFRNE